MPGRSAIRAGSAAAGSQKEDVDALVENPGAHTTQRYLHAVMAHQLGLTLDGAVFEAFGTGANGDHAVDQAAAGSPSFAERLPSRALCSLIDQPPGIR